MGNSSFDLRTLDSRISKLVEQIRIKDTSFTFQPERTAAGKIQQYRALEAKLASMQPSDQAEQTGQYAESATTPQEISSSWTTGTETQVERSEEYPARYDNSLAIEAGNPPREKRPTASGAEDNELQNAQERIRSLETRLAQAEDDCLKRIAEAEEALKSRFREQEAGMQRTFTELRNAKLAAEAAAREATEETATYITRLAEHLGDESAAEKISRLESQLKGLDSQNTILTKKVVAYEASRMEPEQIHVSTSPAAAGIDYLEQMFAALETSTSIISTVDQRGKLVDALSKGTLAEQDRNAAYLALSDIGTTFNALLDIQEQAKKTIEGVDDRYRARTKELDELRLDVLALIDSAEADMRTAEKIKEEADKHVAELSKETLLGMEQRIEAAQRELDKERSAVANAMRESITKRSEMYTLAAQFGSIGAALESKITSINPIRSGMEHLMRGFISAYQDRLTTIGNRGEKVILRLDSEFAKVIPDIDEETKKMTGSDGSIYLVSARQPTTEGPLQGQPTNPDIAATEQLLDSYVHDGVTVLRDTVSLQKKGYAHAMDIYFYTREELDGQMFLRVDIYAGGYTGEGGRSKSIAEFCITNIPSDSDKDYLTRLAATARSISMDSARTYSSLCLLHQFSTIERLRQEWSSAYAGLSSLLDRISDAEKTDKEPDQVSE